MSGYLVCKNVNTTISYRLFNPSETGIAKPYISIQSYGAVPLTSITSTSHPNVVINNSTLRPKCLSTTTQERNYLTLSPAVSGKEVMTIKNSASVTTTAATSRYKILNTITLSNRIYFESRGTTVSNIDWFSNGAFPTLTAIVVCRFSETTKTTYTRTMSYTLKTSYLEGTVSLTRSYTTSKSQVSERRTKQFSINLTDNGAGSGNFAFTTGPNMNAPFTGTYASLANTYYSNTFSYTNTQTLKTQVVSIKYKAKTTITYEL